MRYYECHITINQADQPRHEIREAVERIGWKFSAIDGDPVMGKKVYCYATKHFKKEVPEADVIRELLDTAAGLKDFCNVLRSKVEIVLYDDRQMSCAACPSGVTL